MVIVIPLIIVLCALYEHNVCVWRRGGKTAAFVIYFTHYISQLVITTNPALLTMTQQSQKN